jgi:hypothetical protein
VIYRSGGQKKTVFKKVEKTLFLTFVWVPEVQGSILAESVPIGRWSAYHNLLETYPNFLIFLKKNFFPSQTSQSNHCFDSHRSKEAFWRKTSQSNRDQRAKHYKIGGINFNFFEKFFSGPAIWSSRENGPEKSKTHTLKWFYAFITVLMDSWTF